MLNGVMLQAHRGVSTEYPENTMAAFRASKFQGYDIIELDPACTADGQFVIMHDKTINRTGRKADGSEIEKEIKITDITYKEALGYDFGLWFANKFQGEKIPLMSEVLRFAKENNMPLKIDNKVAGFPEEVLDKFFEVIEESGADVGFTCFDCDFAKKVLSRFPEAEIHYDGEVGDEILKKLKAMVKPGKLTVWVPIKSKLTSWVKVSFADKKMCENIKKYAKLGVWILSEYEEFETAREYGADIVETTGKIKPENRKGIRADMHNHTNNSHDSKCSITELCKAQIEAGNSIFAVTDHFDVEYCKKYDYHKIIRNSFNDAAWAEKEYESRIEVLKGVEAGEAVWYNDEANELFSGMDFDVIIGSVHAVRYPKYEMPFARIDFSEMDEGTVIDYMNVYFDDVYDMVCNTQLDILAHLASPVKYICGNYGRKIDLHMFEDKIEKILKRVIESGIILEVNTSSLSSKYDETMPEEWILKKYKDMGGYMISVGSDSHTAQNAGREFDRAYKMLKDIGFKNAFYVKKRYAIQYTL